MSLTIECARCDRRFVAGEHLQAPMVRVCVGPEFGTLGDADIKKAALEAIKGSKCDLLLV
jgi:adenine-specific DNA-methyltransferase